MSWAALGLTFAAAAHAASFSGTGPLSEPRAGDSATLLANGTVLLAGGYNGGDPLATCELYDPATRRWTAAAALHTGRTRHTATLLPSGKVLVTGGGYNADDATAACELYNPTAGTWSATGSMKSPRVYHRAILLLNGKVLVAGGSLHRLSEALATAELYDPATGTWTATGSLSTTRDDYTSTLLMNGKVLVAGGAPVGTSSSSPNSSSATASAELFDPATQTWTPTSSMNSARWSHQAVLLPSGRVLVSGGANDTGALASAELYDPITGTWQVVSPLTDGRAFHTATLLPDGNILAVGGVDSQGDDLSSAELFDAATGTWTTVGSLSTARIQPSGTVLANGNVLVAGGGLANAPVWFTSAELYDSVAGPIRLLNPIRAPIGGFQFAFTAAPNGTNTVSATSDLALPIANWTALGSAPEFAPGLFLFHDPQTSDATGRFYYVHHQP